MPLYQLHSHQNLLSLCLSYGEDHEGPDRGSNKEKKRNLKPAVGSTVCSLSTFDCKPSDQILMSQNAHRQKDMPHMNQGWTDLELRETHNPITGTRKTNMIFGSPCISFKDLHAFSSWEFTLKLAGITPSPSVKQSIRFSIAWSRKVLSKKFFTMSGSPFIRKASALGTKSLTKTCLGSTFKKKTRG